MNKNKCHSVLDTESHRVLKRQKGEMLNQVQHDVFFYKGAFTLIELLVVVLIIGILASIAVPQYQKAVEKTRMAEAISLINMFKRGTDLYILENGYPNEPVHFTGKEAEGVLSVNLPESYNHETGNAMWSKYFSYHISCANNYCDHIADRLKGREQSYRLFWRTYVSGFVKQCTPNDEMGDFICTYLQKDGWTKETIYQSY